jgi:signal peptidase I
MRKVLAILERLNKPEARIVFPHRRLLKLAVLIGLSFCSYLLFSRLVVTAVEVKGASMAPTLVAGDRLILNRLTYLHRPPQRGDMVVVRDPETGDMIVKRIVGMPNETVLMKNDQVWINGRKLIEPYLAPAAREMIIPFNRAVVVPDNCYFVLGDNRPRSVDSRAFGPVRRSDLLGVINL